MCAECNSKLAGLIALLHMALHEALQMQAKEQPAAVSAEGAAPEVFDTSGFEVIEMPLTLEPASEGGA